MLSSKYFGCTTGTLIELLLDATRLAPATNKDIPEETIDNFYKKVNEVADADTFLFKD
jgi:hypothetical protein